MNEIIDRIKLKGDCIRHQVVGIPNGFYAEPVIIFYNERYYVIYSIYENHANGCPFEDMEEFNLFYQAENRYNQLIVELQQNNEHENN